jgi:carbon-monoxide dehydrogenase medium subunit
LPEVETALNGHSVDEALIREAASIAAQAVDPPEDVHGSADYRRALVATLIERGLRAAARKRGV